MHTYRFGELGSIQIDGGQTTGLCYLVGPDAARVPEHLRQPAQAELEQFDAWSIRVIVDLSELLALAETPGPQAAAVILRAPLSNDLDLNDPQVLAFYAGEPTEVPTAQVFFRLKDVRLFALERYAEALMGQMEAAPWEDQDELLDSPAYLATLKQTMVQLQQAETIGWAADPERADMRSHRAAPGEVVRSAFTVSDYEHEDRELIWFSITPAGTLAHSATEADVVQDIQTVFAQSSLADKVVLAGGEGGRFFIEIDESHARDPELIGDALVGILIKAGYAWPE